MNILAVGAHHDDVEIGCGGTLAKLADQGHKVFVIVLTSSFVHFPHRGIYRSTTVAQAEFRKSTEVLSMTNIEFSMFDNGKLIYDVDTMQKLESLIFMHNIQTMFCHWNYDLNTDHAEASKLCTVAGRYVPNVYQYRSNHYQPDRPFNGIVYSDISGKPMQLKRRALACYKTEIKNRGKSWVESFTHREADNGQAIGVEYAETFEPVRVVI